MIIGTMPHVGLEVGQVVWAGEGRRMADEVFVSNVCGHGLESRPLELSQVLPRS